MFDRSLSASVVTCMFGLAGAACGGTSLAKADVLVDDRDTFGTPAQVLIEEIERRTGIAWKLSAEAGGHGAVEFRAPARGEDLGREGFGIATTIDAPPQITISATDPRGALFAVGYLLRRLKCSPGDVVLVEPIGTTQRPDYEIRGHELGYRAQANSYDAWDPATYDQYIRELAFFGTNCIENIPFQDTRPNPIMPVSRSEMNRTLSGICDKYDVDYWVWTPADFDLTDAARRRAALEFLDYPLNNRFWLEDEFHKVLTLPDLEYRGGGVLTNCEPGSTRETAASMTTSAISDAAHTPSATPRNCAAPVPTGGSTTA